MLGQMFDFVFGCWHSRYSFPITVRSSARRSQAAALTGTYVVCLECGKELPYDWKQMKVISSSQERRAYLRSFQAKQAA